MALSDIDLVMLAKAAQDGAAFSELVRRHQAGLRAFLARLTGDIASADDLAQQTLLKAHAGLASFRGGASFRSWLFAIAIREHLQALRKDSARARLATAVEEKPQETGPHAGLDSALDLHRALRALDGAERAAVLLCDAVGMSHAEAAAALAAPLGTIKSQVARARRKMRALLDPEAPPGAAENEEGSVHVPD